jgi:recombination protein RecA
MISFIFDIPSSYIISNSGSWYTYDNKNIGQGLNNMKKYFVEHDDILNTIETKIYKLINSKEK